jgi:polyphosphate kinase 2 (PPK2 family)
MELSQEDIKLLNSKMGIKKLLSNNNVDIAKALNATKYDIRLKKLQEQLIDLQERVIKKNEIIALPKPTEEEQGQWYFQRYINHFPNPGEIVFFDRSWYNRAVVEPAMDFCTDKQHDEFMQQINPFEKMFTDSGITLIKLYFSITKEEQAKRFEDLRSNSLKKWKLSPVDLRAHELWDTFTKYEKEMFAKTDTKDCPWKIIEANKKTEARIEAIEYILEQTKHL